MKGLSIRRLTSDDVKAYKEIRLELLQTEPTSFGSSSEEEATFSKQHWKDRLNKPYVHTYGAFIDDLMVGLSILLRNPRKKMKHIGHIHSMYIRPTHRKEGIAKKLLEHIFKEAKKASLEVLLLEVVKSNTRALNVYLKAGFTPYGEQINALKYQHKTYDFILMSKQIT